ncbi:MAG: hypothetical protein ACKVP0_26815 [Pirellulaceae bacterium]
MVKSIFWSVLAVAVSMAAAFVFVVAIEVVSAVIHPMPPGMDLHDKEACTDFFASYPQWLLAIAAVSWGLTAFISTWLATRLGAYRHYAHGAAIGLLLLLAVIANLLMLPYPLWFELANLVLMPLGIFLGTWLAMAPGGGPTVVKQVASVG